MTASKKSNMMPSLVLQLTFPYVVVIRRPIQVLAMPGMPGLKVGQKANVKIKSSLGRWTWS